MTDQLAGRLPYPTIHLHFAAHPLQRAPTTAYNDPDAAADRDAAAAVEPAGVQARVTGRREQRGCNTGGGLRGGLPAQRSAAAHWTVIPGWGMQERRPRPRRSLPGAFVTARP